MELPYFKIKFKITKDWLKSAFFDLDKNVKITDEMMEAISTEMNEWMWSYIAQPLKMGVFYDDWNEALYDLLEKVEDKK